ncbi:ATP-binding protein [Mobilibacterium timonense]|uniref:sensor histidine kinase n=1 Tax=Mobilibacterium timonense TaxID=1871012 RepID=UPI003A8E22F8
MINKYKGIRVKRGSFINTIVRNYIIFSALLIVLIYAVAYLTSYNTYESTIDNGVKKLASAYREADDLDKVKYQKYIGNGSGVVILDRSGKTVYIKGRCPVKTFTQDSIKLIPKNDEIVDVDIHTSTRGDGEKVLFIQRRWTTDIYSEYIDSADTDVLDTKHNVIYSTKFPDKTKYTNDEYKVLTGKFGKDISIIKTGLRLDGKKYTLVAFQKLDMVSAMNRRERNTLLIVAGTIVAYVLMILIFSRLITRKVKKPVNALERAMSDVSQGKTGGLIVYDGPTEFVDMCDSFNVMSKKLEESEKENQAMRDAQQKMISGIAHDLKTPVTVIQGYAKAINDGLVDDQEKYLKTIEEKSQRLTELIDEFHQYAMMNRPDLKLNIETVDICEYTREYLAGRYPEMDIEGRHLSLDIPDDCISVRIDKSRFNRVYNNIVNNYLKYCGENSTFYCSMYQRDDKAVITLGDDGPGIPAEVRKTIFDPFVKGDSSRASGGSGLGLSIARDVVRGCGGNIILTDYPADPMKTEFVITLPVWQEEEEDRSSRRTDTGFGEEK